LDTADDQYADRGDGDHRGLTLVTPIPATLTETGVPFVDLWQGR
jgi:hypothetical protein